MVDDPHLKPAASHLHTLPAAEAIKHDTNWNFNQVNKALQHATSNMHIQERTLQIFNKHTHKMLIITTNHSHQSNPYNDIFAYLQIPILQLYTFFY